MTVRTNNVPRPTIDAWQLTPKERLEFDYLDWSAIEQGTNSATFFRYRGQLYDLSEFVESPPLFTKGWDAFCSDSFFSGILIRYIQSDYDNDQVIVGALYV